MTIEERASAFPRRDAPELLAEPPSKIEGAGKAGCSLHPQPRAQSVESTRVSHHRFAEQSSLPSAMVLTFSFVLPPSSADCSANLAPASGRQNHTTSSVRASNVRLTCYRVHRIPHPTFVTIAKRPSCECRTRESVALICPTAQAEYFWPGD